MNDDQHKREIQRFIRFVRLFIIIVVTLAIGIYAMNQSSKYNKQSNQALCALGTANQPGCP
jgi:hypothetical protein